MFKSIITNTQLTTEVANGFFDGRIMGSSWNRDVSFLATLRALLQPRMPDGDSLQLTFKQSNHSAEALAGVSVHNAISAIFNEPVTSTITVHNFNHPAQASNRAWMEMIQASFEQDRPGWRRIESVTRFFHKQLNILCYVNLDKKSVVLFVEDMNIRQYHFIQAGIPVFMPWYYEREVGVTAEEMELLNSLKEKTESQYLDCIERFAKRYDFKTSRIRALLSGFEHRFEQMKCDEVRQNIRHIDGQINDYNNYIADYIRQRREYEALLLGLEMKIQQSEGESEIMEYFLRNQHLSLRNVTNTEMEFVAMDYLTYFDEDMAKGAIRNQASYVYRPNGRACNNYIQAEDMKMLMTEIFIKQTLRIRFCAAYRFRLEGNVRALSNYNFGSEFREYMPNPHIDRYNCMGGNERHINKCLQERNYIGALEQCIASCKSLNFGDSIVMQEFMRQLYGLADDGKNNRCIELPDGRVVNAKDAVEFLKQQQEQPQPTEEVQADG